MARRRSVTYLASPNLTILILAILAAASAPIRAHAAQVAEFRPFTIEDSIELSNFVNPVLWTVNQDPPTDPIVSPDGRFVLLITQRGILASNEIESTIWLFSGDAISEYVRGKSSKAPTPTRVASSRATSNTPVISDVRWLSDSRRVAFLGKSGTDTIQLYVADAITGTVKRITHSEHPVSAYDIQGKTIAYTTLDNFKEAPENNSSLIDVTGMSIWTLLWRDRPISERDESWLLIVPNTLHIIKNGSETATSFSFEGGNLKLFFPILSLSPDEKSLITIAPVPVIYPKWQAYQPRFGYEEFKLNPKNKTALNPENAWRASQFVDVNLETGIGTPILDAPAGRSVFQIFAPTKAIWSSDSQNVLLSNTFLPLPDESSSSYVETIESPAAVIVNVATNAFQLVSYLPQPPRGSPPVSHIFEITWDPTSSKVEFSYASTPDNVALSVHDTYCWTNGAWHKTAARNTDPVTRLSVEQDLNLPPVFAAQVAKSQKVFTVWDPNPQLASVALGRASLYNWQDSHGNSRTGILVLPADYRPGARYPLVIQTHGFEPKKFFTDGIYTTGSGGRALCGRGIIVLQVDQYSKTANPQKDAELEVDAFRSAIGKLSAAGLADKKRVGIIGFSFTVYHVLYAITHYPDLFAVASITDGNDLSYWLYLLWADIPFAQDMAVAANGGVMPFGKNGLSKWAESAPGFNLDRVTAPLLISCLEKGTLVATWDIYASLRTLNKPVDLMWLRNEDAPHVLVQPLHRYLSQETAVNWFDFWLNAHEDLNTEHAGQYKKWHMLRELKDKEHKP
jgi:dipeptidyl aminopeptidase/acylaminoacyl peptidase